MHTFLSVLLSSVMPVMLAVPKFDHSCVLARRTVILCLEVERHSRLLVVHNLFTRPVDLKSGSKVWADLLCEQAVVLLGL